MPVEGRGNRVTPYRFLWVGSTVKSDGDVAPDINGGCYAGEVRWCKPDPGLFQNVSMQIGGRDEPASVQ